MIAGMLLGCWLTEKLIEAVQGRAVAPGLASPRRADS